MTQSLMYSSRPWRVRVFSPCSPVMMAVTPFCLSQREEPAQLGAHDGFVGQAGEERFEAVEHDALGADAVNGVAEADEQALQVELAGLLDLAALDADVVHGDFLAADERGQVEAERGDVVGQFLAGFLEGHEDARLVELAGAAHDELHGQQGLAAAGGAADQRGPALGQAAVGDFVQAADAGGGFGQRRRRNWGASGFAPFHSSHASLRSRSEAGPTGCKRRLPSRELPRSVPFRRSESNSFFRGSFFRGRASDKVVRIACGSRALPSKARARFAKALLVCAALAISKAQERPGPAASAWGAAPVRAKKYRFVALPMAEEKGCTGQKLAMLCSRMPVPDSHLYHEEESGSAVRTAQGQPAGSHLREDGQGRVRHLGQQPVLHALRGRRGARDPPDPRAGDQPLRRARLPGLRHHGIRLDSGERLQGARGRRVAVQQGDTPDGSLGAGRAGGLADQVGQGPARQTHRHRGWST